ncbi:hypothetical protein PCC9214_00246 [Planktothrix tepida]|uniref:Uncharacterized protein n=2 Tax=Planktothrix TaxID=54304 RepID=A0A1J1LF61_9CYAN|nr:MULTISPECIES: cysteine hydrolase family protein [Planktothrix]CAD5914346.1 hypothetical protein PCC9214_00246 [Planktothrix tepida]CAD5986195.1 hypothetical protein NO713_05571 [Planktothrix pseudagardhii]CUR30548.1 conserved hypothetical protein [Planktothrix tepida PCC 9214]
MGVTPKGWNVNATEAKITRPPLKPRPIPLTTETKTLRLDLAKTALIIIDMQNDFCYSDGWLGYIGVDITPARQPIVPLNTLIPVLRSVQVPIIGLNWENRPNLLNISTGLHHVYNSTGEETGTHIIKNTGSTCL